MTSETFYFKMADAIAVLCQCKYYENQVSPQKGMQEKESIMRVRYGYTNLSLRSQFGITWL